MVPSKSIFYTYCSLARVTDMWLRIILCDGLKMQIVIVMTAMRKVILAENCDLVNVNVQLFLLSLEAFLARA